MRVAGEVRFLLGVLLAGLAGLAGGQVWVLTDSALWSWAVGVATFALLWGVCRAAARWSGLGRARPLLGEVRRGVSAHDYTEVISADAPTRERVQKKVRSRPERVADSVRALLVQGRHQGDSQPRQEG